MTQHLGPRDYEVTGPCGACSGTGLAKANPAAGAEPLHHVPHTLAGLRGAFIGEHGPTPTEQEIWNGAIASWRDLNPPPATSERDAEDARRLIADVDQSIDGYAHVYRTDPDSMFSGRSVAYDLDKNMRKSIHKIMDAQREQSAKRSGEGGK